MTVTPLPCPFCGADPEVHPLRPEVEGDAWGAVICTNEACPAQPSVDDDEPVIRAAAGSDFYKMSAIRLWNKRIGR